MSLFGGAVMKINRVWGTGRSPAVSSSRRRAAASSAGAWTGSADPRRPRGTHIFLLNFCLYIPDRRFSVSSPVIHREMRMPISFVKSKSRSYQMQASKQIHTAFTKLPWHFRFEACTLNNAVPPFFEKAILVPLSLALQYTNSNSVYR